MFWQNTCISVWQYSPRKRWLLYLSFTNHLHGLCGHRTHFCNLKNWRPLKPSVWVCSPQTVLQSILISRIRNRIYHRSSMQTEKYQPEGKRIMPETRLTEFPALSVDPRVEISRSASETDVWLFFLPMTLKTIFYHSSFILFLTLDVIRCFSWCRISDVTYEV